MRITQPIDEVIAFLVALELSDMLSRFLACAYAVQMLGQPNQRSSTLFECLRSQNGLESNTCTKSKRDCIMLHVKEHGYHCVLETAGTLLNGLLNSLASHRPATLRKRWRPVARTPQG